MHDVVCKKSSLTKVEALVAYDQGDYQFSDRFWQAMKYEVEAWISKTGISDIGDPPSVPV